jgi:fatty-acyl-CoA synthase
MADNRNGAGSRLRALTATFADLARNLRDPEWKELTRRELAVLPAAARATFPWLLKAREDRDESLIKVALRNAELDPEGLAFEMEDVRLTWSDVDSQSSRLAHVLADLGVQRGDVVALLGYNSPFYIVAVLGISRVGATAALINNHLEGHPLSHAVKVSHARTLLVQKRLEAALRSRSDLSGQLEHVLVYEQGDLERRMSQAPSAPFSRVPVSASSDYVYIYTSGTTGLPKPCRVTHARSLIAGAAFGPLLFQFQPGDKLYSVLPLYHSSALLIGAGSCILSRTPICMREAFSAKAFWSDVRRYNATAMIYIGELCRYLLNTPPSEEEKNNSLRVAVGNGLRADVWEPFQTRFEIAEIREFYSATEAPGAIFNLSGKVGSIGHVPMRRLGKMKLALYDVASDELVRTGQGLCVECGPEQVGELLIKLEEKPRSALGEFRGYTDEQATQKKILHDVFEPGDRYFRSGDLMRFDDKDYFYFVDRIGDTYRWKGENVSTAEVAELLSVAPGVLEATVSGVHVPGMEGQAGLAAVVCKDGFDANGFWRAAQELPDYAKPRFVRVLGRLSTTGTFKIQKTQLRSDGVDPTKISDPIYFLRDDGYVRLTPELWNDVTEGRVRL